MQRVHWDPEFARRSGNPTTFDYGRMRETWLIHLCTDWMGDDAWLWKLDCEFRQVQLRRRHAVAARAASCASTSPTATGRPSTSSSRAENQRGELTTPGHATILLPSREHGAVRLPDPPGGARRPHRRRSTRSPSSSPRPMTDSFDDRGRRARGRLDGGVLRLELDRPEKRNALDDAMIAGPHRRRRRGRHRRARARDRALAARATTSAAAPTSSPATRDRSARPRIGSIQRRLPAQAHRLIPLMIDGPDAGRVRGAGLGGRHRVPARARRRLHRRRRRRDVLGAVHRTRLHPRQRRDLAAAPRWSA